MAMTPAKILARLKVECPELVLLDDNTMLSLIDIILTPAETLEHMNGSARVIFSALGIDGINGNQEAARK